MIVAEDDARASILPLIIAFAIILTWVAVWLIFFIVPFAYILPLAMHGEKPLAAVILCACEMFNMILGLPIWPLQVSMGVIFGVWPGILVAIFGYTISTLPCYFIGPMLLPALGRLAASLRGVLAPLQGRCGADRIVSCLAPSGGGFLDGLALTAQQQPFELVLAIRLNLLPPAGLMSLSLGALKVPFIPFVCGSALGTIPNSLAYVYIGSIATEIAALLNGESPEFDVRSLSLMAGAFVASAALVVYLSVMAVRRIEELRESRPYVEMPP